MQFDFLEWLKAKTLIDEAQRRVALSSHAVEGIAKVKDIVISNPISFFDKVLYIPKGVGSDVKIPKLKNVKMSPSDFSSWVIISIDDREVKANRLMNPILPQEIFKSKSFDYKRLRDVTDSFASDDLLSVGKDSKRYFVDLGKTNEVEKLYQVYQQLTRHSALGGAQGQQDAAIKNILAGDDVNEKGRTGGQQAVASMINKGADNLKIQHYLKLAHYASGGADMTSHIKDDTQDANFVQWIRRIGAGNLIDQMHKKGMSRMIAGEERGQKILQTPQQNNQSPFDALFRKAESNSHSITR
jgi:hypothetical protein